MCIRLLHCRLLQCAASSASVCKRRLGGKTLLQFPNYTQRTSIITMVYSCVAVDCANRKKPGCTLSFYRFPSDPRQTHMWVTAAKRKNWQPNPERRLCSQHFTQVSTVKIDPYYCVIRLNMSRLIKKHFSNSICKSRINLFLWPVSPKKVQSHSKVSRA